MTKKISSNPSPTQQQLIFEAELDRFTGMVAVKDGDAKKNYSHITACYSLLPKRITKTPKTGHSVMRSFSPGDNEQIDMVIHPAVLADKSGRQSLVFPKLVEDRVEDAIGYIAAQGAVKRNVERVAIGVYFTINQIRKVLSDLMGVKYNHAQIRAALEVLAGSSIDLKWQRPGWVFNRKITRISGLTFGDTDSNSGEKDTQCFCYLNELFAREIADGSYTIHDLRWQGRIKGEMAQELFKKLMVFYRHANSGNEYNFDGRKFLENTSLGFYKTNPSKSWTSLSDALIELAREEVIQKKHQERIVWEPSTGGRPSIRNKIIIVKPTPRFIQHMKMSHWVEKKGESIYYDTLEKLARL